MKRKIIKILGIILIIVVVLGLALVAYTYYKIETGQLVQWEGKWYTQEELNEKYPPQEYEVEAKNTPEEVYTKFRQAVLNDNKEKALEYVVEDQRDKYREAFQDEKKFNKWIERLPEEINKERIQNNHASYYYLNAKDESDDIAHPINFIKNKRGYWRIESI